MGERLVTASLEQHKAQELQGISHSNDVESYFWETWNSQNMDLVETGLGKRIDYGLHAYRFCCNTKSRQAAYQLQSVHVNL
ncbi:MAG: hypothetical protein LBP35_03980 [Candidatus Ancillula trichonymphae]|nr:hypothetical protein [Candidatus Ancillula trichonymphae]